MYIYEYIWIYLFTYTNIDISVCIEYINNISKNRNSGQNFTPAKSIPTGSQTLNATFRHVMREKIEVDWV